jgi:A/G-specific adenine glycosylase
VAQSRFATGLLSWSDTNRRDFPWRDPERGAWPVLLAELLLRQTDAKRVVPVFEHLVQIAPSPAALATISAGDLEGILRPLGLHRQRAAGLKALGDAVASRYAGNLPADASTLRSLPHVGPYAAGAVAVFCDGKRAALPDVNVARVGGRYFGMPTGTRREQHAVASRVAKNAPPRKAKEFYLAILDLSALVCKPKPRCPQCPLQTTCRFARAVVSTRIPRRTIERAQGQAANSA